MQEHIAPATANIQRLALIVSRISDADIVAPEDAARLLARVDQAREALLTCHWENSQDCVREIRDEALRLLDTDPCGSEPVQALVDIADQLLTSETIPQNSMA